VIESLNGVDSFVDSLLDMRHRRNCAVVYSLDRPRLPSGFYDHEMAVGIDKDSLMGVISFVDEENYVSRGSKGGEIGEYMLLGHVREFVPGSEIPADAIRRAVKEFLESGGKIPACIEWKVEEW
jgi:hypothetical protein